MTSLKSQNCDKTTKKKHYIVTKMRIFKIFKNERNHFKQDHFNAFEDLDPIDFCEPPFKLTYTCIFIQLEENEL